MFKTNEHDLLAIGSPRTWMKHLIRHKSVLVDLFQVGTAEEPNPQPLKHASCHAGVARVVMELTQVGLFRSL